MKLGKKAEMIAALAICAGACVTAAEILKRRSRIKSKKQREAVTFAHLAMSLADDYTSVYYIDIEDDSYVEFSAVGSDHRLKTVSQGDDFFADTKTNCRLLVYKDDQQRFISALQKEKLLEVVRSGGTFTLNYRLVLDNEPLFFNLKACRALEYDPKHIVVGVRNVDAQTRKELAYEKALGQAMNLAERDGLTGVKNKNAYEHTENRLISQIENGTAEFAIVMCDVNGLKQINDTLGHLAGDEHLKTACAMICRIFKHSPVFRIGGDEFAAVLTGDDYRDREALTRELRRQVRQNIGTDQPTFGCGMAVYIPGKDKTPTAVFNRADAAMYRNKKQFVNARADDGNC